MVLKWLKINRVDVKLTLDSFAFILFALVSCFGLNIGGHSGFGCLLTGDYGDAVEHHHVSTLNLVFNGWRQLE